MLEKDVTAFYILSLSLWFHHKMQHFIYLLFSLLLPRNTSAQLKLALFKWPIIYHLWFVFVLLVPLILSCTCALKAFAISLWLCSQQPLNSGELLNLTNFSSSFLWLWGTFPKASEQWQLIASLSKNIDKGENFTLLQNLSFLLMLLLLKSK